MFAFAGIKNCLLVIWSKISQKLSKILLVINFSFRRQFRKMLNSNQEQHFAKTYLKILLVIIFCFGEQFSKMLNGVEEQFRKKLVKILLVINFAKN
jgi:hypothetical protein